MLRRALRRERAATDAEPGMPARLLARALGRAGRRREAVRVLARAAWRYPRQAELHVDLAATLLARCRPAAAERALLRGLAVLPGSARLWASAAELALEGGRLDLARSRLRSALRRDRRNALALALLVRLLAERGRWLHVVHAARAALRVLPADHPAGKEKGRALLHLGRAGEAALPLRRYVLAAPADPEGYRLLGRALEGQGDSQGALVQRRLGAVVGAGA